jgi:hypothetical protein
MANPKTTANPVERSAANVPAAKMACPDSSPDITLPDITFVCCVESGSLEAVTLRMVESLRRHGGKFANAPVIAVTPRFGSPLARATQQAFKRLQITHVWGSAKTNYGWFKFLNKPLALVAAEAQMTTTTAAWLDSDLLFVDEPSQLTLLPGEDFTGFPVEAKEMGTTGPGDVYEPLWQEFCRVLALDIDSLPWRMTAQTQERVRLYFDGGIFVYRRATGFAQAYLETCLQLLDARVASQDADYNVGVKEMSAIGLALVKMGLSWRPLPYAYDYSMGSSVHADWYSEELLQNAKIVHFHDGMWPAFWPTLLECLHRTHPPTAKWLAPLGELQDTAPLQWRLLNKWLRRQRAQAEQRYHQTCTLV